MNYREDGEEEEEEEEVKEVVIIPSDVEGGAQYRLRFNAFFIQSFQSC